MYEEPVVVPLIPEFLKDEETLTGASRGSAYHKLWSFWIFTAGYGVNVPAGDREYDGQKKLTAAVEKFRQEGRLTDEMAECIRPSDILKFLGCESGRRMSAAAQKGKLYKEQPFCPRYRCVGDLSGGSVRREDPRAGNYRRILLRNRTDLWYWIIRRIK